MKSLVDWKQVGTIFRWRYTDGQRNYPGFHFTADGKGVVSMASFFEVLEKSESGLLRTISITAASRAELSVPNNKSSITTSPKKLRVRLAEEAASIASRPLQE